MSQGYKYRLRIKLNKTKCSRGALYYRLAYQVAIKLIYVLEDVANHILKTGAFSLAQGPMSLSNL